MCSLCVTGRLPAVRGRQQRFEEAAEDGEGGGDHLGHARPQGLRHAGKLGGRQVSNLRHAEFAAKAVMF